MDNFNWNLEKQPAWLRRILKVLVFLASLWAGWFLLIAVGADNPPLRVPSFITFMVAIFLSGSWAVEDFVRE